MLVQAACSHAALKEVIISKSLLFLPLQGSIDELEGKQGNSASVNTDPRETQLGMVSEFLLFVIAALDSHNLASIPIGFINPANNKQKLSFCFFLKE